jgi:hypothetical protein
MAHYIRKPVYLHTPIDFGKYRLNHMSIKEIIDSGVEGLQWVKWLMSHSWNFKPNEEVAEYIEKKEVEYGLLQPERS